MHNYKFYLFLLIFGVVFSSCEKTDNTIIDPTLSFPTIISAYVTPITVDTTYLNNVIGATVRSELPIGSVTARVSNPDNVLIATVDLKDDGVFPDSAAGDGKFTARINYTMDCRIVGNNYKIEIIAKNNSGLSSNVFNITFSVINSHNVPPVVSGFFVTPHDAVLNQPVFISFWTRASDPDGPCDIYHVQCTGFKPDNSAITPFDLFDDGNLASTGDTTANDGHFTRAAFGQPLLAGYFKYFVRAYDRSGDSSNVLIDSIFVHP